MEVGRVESDIWGQGVGDAEMIKHQSRETHTTSFPQGRGQKTKEKRFEHPPSLLRATAQVQAGGKGQPSR